MRLSSRLAVPLRRPEDVIPHLGERFHWKQGRSAKALVDYWWGATGLPAPVQSMFDQTGGLADAELLDAWLERETDLEDGERTASQTDLVALIGLAGELAVLGVEAKAGETFGPTVTARLAGNSPGARRRVERLCDRLGVPTDAAGALRYQLLHRAVATINEARRFRAAKAVMLIQSFHDDPRAFADVERFATAIGFSAMPRGKLTEPRRFGEVELWLGWLDSAVPLCGLTIEEVRRTTTMSPTQWEGALTDGRPIHIRYRWGELSVRIGKRGWSPEQVAAGQPWFHAHIGEETDSMIELPRVLNTTGLAMSPTMERER